MKTRVLERAKSNLLLLCAYFVTVKNMVLNSYIRKNSTSEILVINNLSKNKIIVDIPLPITTIIKNNRKITRLRNLLTGENVRVNVTFPDNTIHMLLAPYQVLWFDAGCFFVNIGRKSFISPVIFSVH